MDNWYWPMASFNRWQRLLREAEIERLSRESDGCPSTEKMRVHVWLVCVLSGEVRKMIS